MEAEGRIGVESAATIAIEASPAGREALMMSFVKDCKGQLVIGILLACAVPVLADQVTPKSDASVVVRAAADSRSARVGTLAPGDRATVLGEESRWWNVKLTDGTEGFVSKRATEVVADSGGGAGDGSGGPSDGTDHSGEGWNAFAGYPRCVAGTCQFAVLEKHDFTVGYSETRRDPL